MPYEKLKFSINEVSLTAKLEYNNKSGTINFLLQAEEVYEVFAENKVKEIADGISVDPYGDMYLKQLNFFLRTGKKQVFLLNSLTLQNIRCKF